MNGMKPENAIEGPALMDALQGMQLMQVATGAPDGGVINQFKADNNISDVAPAPAAPQVKAAFDMNM
jgi:hypothetical protein